MGQYGKAAILATRLYCEGRASSPRDAWVCAIATETDSESSRDKCCPMDAFLGLCDEGLVRGIPAGQYGPANNVNGRYAIDAYRLLQAEPRLTSDKPSLWARIPDPRAENQNGQLDVVIALFSNGLLTQK